MNPHLQEYDPYWFEMASCDPASIYGSQNSDHIAFGAIRLADDDGSAGDLDGTFAVCLDWFQNDENRGADAVGNQRGRYVYLSLDQMLELGKALTEFAQREDVRAAEYRRAVKSSGDS